MLVGWSSKPYQTPLVRTATNALARFQYGLEKVQTTNKMIPDDTKGILRP